MMQQGQGAELSISPPHGVLSLSPALEQKSGLCCPGVLPAAQGAPQVPWHAQSGVLILMAGS
jgi:hypothetical protein